MSTLAHAVRPTATRLGVEPTTSRSHVRRPNRYRVFTRSSKLPANVQHYICWKFARRLLDRVNTPLHCQTTLFDRLLVEYPVPNQKVPNLFSAYKSLYISPWHLQRLVLGARGPLSHRCQFNQLWRPAAVKILYKRSYDERRVSPTWVHAGTPSCQRPRSNFSHFTPVCSGEQLLAAGNYRRPVVDDSTRTVCPSVRPSVRSFVKRVAVVTDEYLTTVELSYSTSNNCELDMNLWRYRSATQWFPRRTTIRTTTLLCQAPAASQTTDS